MTTSIPGKPDSGRPHQVTALFILFAILGLHVWFLSQAGGLWRDEVNSVNLAHSGSLATMAQDSFPVLLPVFIQAWSAVGLAGSDISLRLLGILFGLSLAGALWLASWTARGTAPILGLTLLGLNGAVIFWGDSLRAFGLGAALIVGTLAAMGALLNKPTWPRTAILSLVAVLSVQALYQNAVLFASIGLGGWFVCWLRKDFATALKILAAGLAAILSVLPYSASLVRWSQSAAAIRPGFSLKAATGNMNTVAAFPLPQYVWAWGLLGLVVMGLGLAAMLRPHREPVRTGSLRQSELQVFAGVTLAASLAGYFGFLYYAALITEPWYFLPLFALAAACFDLGISLSSLPRLFRTMSFGGLLATALIATVFSAHDLHARFTNVDHLARYLKEKVAPEDYVVVTPWYWGISFARYYQGAAPWDTIPPVADHSTHRYDLVPVTEADQERATKVIVERMAEALQGGHRVWIVGLMKVPSPGRKAATPEGNFLVEHSQSFEPVDLKLAGRTSDFEDGVLLEAAGWRETPP